MEGRDVRLHPLGVEVAHLAVEVELGRVDGDVAEVMRVRGAFQPIHPAHDVVVALPRLMGIETHHQVIRVIEDDGEVVPAVACRLALAAAGAIGAHRFGVEHPGGDIQRMNVLLGDNVAR